MATFRPHTGQGRGQVWAPLGGIRERNQGTFPNSVISLGRNCEHGGDIFSDFFSFPGLGSVPHFSNILLPNHHTASAFFHPEREGLEAPPAWKKNLERQCLRPKEDHLLGGGDLCPPPHDLPM